VLIETVENHEGLISFHQYLLKTTMNISKITAITYSPTRTSFKIANGIQKGIKAPGAKTVDLTYPGVESHSCVPGELAIITMPVYGGRVAPLGAERLGAVDGNSCPAVIVVLYGNREFEDALLELHNLAESRGFKVVGGAAFIGEHSFSSPAMPIAEGRPDALDLAKAEDFGRQIEAYLNTVKDLSSLSSLQIPGNTPYKDGSPKKNFIPLISIDLCTNCGTCLTACPNGAISQDKYAIIDMEKCTFCCACMKICPEKAVSIDQTPAQKWVEMLHTKCNARKEPQLFCR
jgi:ferredoxin